MVDRMLVTLVIGPEVISINTAEAGVEAVEAKMIGAAKNSTISRTRITIAKDTARDHTTKIEVEEAEAVQEAAQGAAAAVL